MQLQGFEKLIEAFNLALEAENAAKGVRRKSYMTDDMVKLNAQREEIYAGLFYHYQSSLRHYDAGKREAAKDISHIMKSIAYIHNTSNIDRYAYIFKITANIRKPAHAAAVETLELTGWLAALDALNEAHRTTANDRDSERSKRGNGNVLVARKATDKAYQEIVARVNAVMILNGPEEFDYFVRLLNVHLAHAKKSIAIRDGWKRHKKEEKKDE
ncbi:MAG TPA: DUF6261 family protein [Paludibacter sp.]|nr:DUF6261 family protein [Paludibacter sp.]